MNTEVDGSSELEMMLLVNNVITMIEIRSGPIRLSDKTWPDMARLRI